MHMIIYPSATSTTLDSTSALNWLLLSDRGVGGLADVTSPDFAVSRDAMSANSHIEVGDYVLLYATKRRPNRLTVPGGGRSRVIFTDTSTWTWKIRGDVMKALRAQVEEDCRALNFGADVVTHAPGTGLRGLLAAQCGRPLFAGVRNQIIDLYRYAVDTWVPYRNAWLTAHPRRRSPLEPSAGILPPVSMFIKYHLPTVPQLRLYDTPARKVRDLLTHIFNGTPTSLGS